jgi:hypothetical protein
MQTAELDFVEVFTRIHQKRGHAKESQAMPAAIEHAPLFNEIDLWHDSLLVVRIIKIDALLTK